MIELLKLSLRSKADRQPTLARPQGSGILGEVLGMLFWAAAVALALLVI